MTIKNKKLFSVSLAVLIVLASVALYYFFFNESSGDNIIIDKGPDEKLLAGSWIRTDGGYRIRINSVKEDGTLEASYFNPSPINVSRAEWLRESGTLRIFIELRDRNYPGSQYLLSYLPEEDKFAGDYYQALQGITFYVEFLRSR